MLVELLARYAGRTVRDRPPVPERQRAVTALMSTPRGQAALLAGYQRLPAAVWAGELHGKLVEAYADGTRAIDRPADRTFIGWCPGREVAVGCGAALYAVKDAATARCPRCRSPWPVEASRAALLADATHHRADATTLARALRIPASTIRSWRHRGLLEQAVDEDGRPAYDPHGRPQYAVADVRRLALGMTARGKAADVG